MRYLGILMEVYKVAHTKQVSIAVLAVVVAGRCASHRRVSVLTVGIMDNVSVGGVSVMMDMIATRSTAYATQGVAQTSNVEHQTRMTEPNVTATR